MDILGKIKGVGAKKDSEEEGISEALEAEEEARKRSFGGRWSSFKEKLKSGATKVKGGAGTAARGAGRLDSFVHSWFFPIVILILTVVFGGVFGFFFPLLLIIGLAVFGVIVGYRLFPRLTKWILFIFIIIVIFGFIIYSPLAGKLGVSPEQIQVTAAQSTKATAGTQAQVFSTLGCITGAGNCDEILYSYRSEEAETEYVEGTKDVGAKISNLRQARDFYSNTPLVVQGVIDAKGFLGKPITVNVKAESLNLAEQIAKAFGATTWECVPKSETAPLIRNKYFACSHSGITVGPKDTAIVPVEVFVTSEGTATLASKQFALTSPETIATIDGDKLSYFDFDANDFKSLQIGDDSINLGISATSREDVLSTSFDNYIAVQAHNPASGKADIKNIYIYIPKSMKDSLDAESDFSCGKSLTDEEIKFLGNAVGQIEKCEAKNTNKDLEPSKSHTWFVKLSVPKESLVGNVNTFFITAYAIYDYENSNVLSLEVRGQ